MYKDCIEVMKERKRKKNIKILGMPINVNTFINQCETDGIPTVMDFVDQTYPEDERLARAIFDKNENIKRWTSALNGYITLLKEYNKYLEAENNNLKEKLNIYYNYGTRMASEQIADFVKVENNNNKIRINNEFIMLAQSKKNDIKEN